MLYSALLFILILIGLYFIWSANGRDCFCPLISNRCKIDLECLQTNSSVHGKCLSECDKIMDQAYNKCLNLPLGQRGDCISECYKNKSKCYMKCMGDVINNGTETGCASCVAKK